MEFQSDDSVVLEGEIKTILSDFDKESIIEMFTEPLSIQEMLNFVRDFYGVSDEYSDETLMEYLHDGDISELIGDKD